MGVKKLKEVMIRIVKAKEQEKKKPGRKPKLILEDQILMTLQF